MKKRKPNKKKAYELRCKTRLQWRIIAEKAGYKTGSGARRGAIRHAIKHNLPLPPVEYLSQGALSYQIRKEERLKWGDIAVELTTKTDYARKNAQRYATRWKKPRLDE